MIRALLSRLTANPDPTAAESIANAIQAVRHADISLAAAVDWTLPPMQPATAEQRADLMRIQAYALTARAALEEATR